LSDEVASEVIVVHGLWFGAWAMRPLAHRLRKAGRNAGWSVRVASYRSTRGTLDDHAHALYRFTQHRGASSRHFAAHSLGGLVVLRMFSLYPEQAPGRIVCLGSPLQGSRVARKANRIPGVRFLLGQAQPELEAGYSRLPADHPAGMIAGTRRFGLGLFVGEFRTPGDGTVALEETRSHGLAGRIEIPVTHTGLVTSARVARQVSSFLEDGSFASPVSPG
jgi:pimeloyl-ACP methyl ester carboxylesterase